MVEVVCKFDEFVVNRFASLFAEESQRKMPPSNEVYDMVLQHVQLGRKSCFGERTPDEGQQLCNRKNFKIIIKKKITEFVFLVSKTTVLVLLVMYSL